MFGRMRLMMGRYSNAAPFKRPAGFNRPERCAFVRTPDYGNLRLTFRLTNRRRGGSFGPRRGLKQPPYPTFIPAPPTTPFSPTRPVKNPLS